MAGLREACSHIAALLFSAEAHTKYILPPSLQNVSYAPISDIYFSALVQIATLNAFVVVMVY